MARRGNDVYKDSGAPDERIVLTNVISSTDTCSPDYGSSAAANLDLKLALVDEPRQVEITVPAEGELSAGSRFGIPDARSPPCLS